MGIFKNISKKFRDEKGLTGADVVVSIAIIGVTIALITGIYINITNTSKENIRYSAATRIATQISENIQAMSYDEFIKIGNIDISSNAGGTRRAFDTAVPRGYSVTVTSSKLSTTLDIVREVNVEVTYRVNNNLNNDISLKFVKERELLEQTNKPDLSLLPSYKQNYKYCYPIKEYGGSGSYVTTTESDSDWYNYDEGTYAKVYLTNSVQILGNNVSTSSGLVCEWVPRFGVDSGVYSFLYGASRHKIVFKNVDLENNLYTYTVDFSDGAYNDVAGYIDGTFADNDGLSGMWYVSSGDLTLNSQEAIDAYNTLLTM